ncbi:MAG: HAMP domain-containing histidine kinase [Nitrospirota bacterium]|nr:HAMP domain-containing histidine kinase [Nitrospirota bacterium]
MIRSIPLHFRFVLPVVFLLGATVALLGLALHGPLTTSMGQLFQGRIESAANTTAVLVQEAVQEMQNLGVSLAYSKALPQFPKQGHMAPQDIASRVKNQGGLFLAFGETSLLEPTPQVQTFLREARTQGNYSVAYFHKKTPVILVFILVRAPDRPDRILTIGIPLDQPFLDTLARKVGLPIALSDSSGHPLVMSRQAATIFPQQFDQGLAGQSNFSDGDSYLWRKQPLPENNPLGLQLILATSSKPLEQVLLVILHNWVLTALVLLTIGSLLYFWLVKTIVKPLNQLVQAAEQVAGGNFDIQISDPKSDEVGRLSQAFNKMTTGLQEVDRAKGAFLAYVSHELRTPLTSIVGFASRISSGGRQEHVKTLEAADIIRKEGDRMVRLVEDLLFLGSVEAGKIEWRFSSFYPYAVIQSCIDLMIPAAEEKGLNLTLTGSSDLPEVIGDNDRIKQALLNLLSNAIAYTPQGSIQVQVSANPIARTWSVVVADTGVGLATISPMVIFDPFVRGQKDSKGAGIGLAVVREVMVAHGGTVTCTPNQPEGLRFTLNFPMAPTEQSGRIGS